ncbi:hypothetical protein IPA_09105 [Ignicoccus pacificus DSM 13166]|uniref:Fe/B12 periplasmic-binding domain-containing protein n=1 Tax=Ignicoccus pacificus DSM 13166 TaxID=940294 RepID=A0A977KD33_9CREN|nr:hypothetical protein IPA_09105 [Ignicoccus pacificus DSM 13166]
MRWGLALLILTFAAFALKVAAIGCNLALSAAVLGGSRVQLVGTHTCAPYGIKAITINDIGKVKADIILAPENLKGKIDLPNVIYLNFTTISKYKESVEKLANAFGTQSRAEEVLNDALKYWNLKLYDLSGFPKVWSNLTDWRIIAKKLGGIPTSKSEAEVIISSERVPITVETYYLWKYAPNSVLEPFVYQAFAKALWPAREIKLNPNANAKSYLSKYLGHFNGQFFEKVPMKRHWVTIKDVLGREVRVLVPVKRAAVLYGLEDWVAVGGEDALTKIVALNAWRYKKWRPDWWVAWTEHYPWLEEIPDVGQPGWSFNLEALLEARPDVVVTTPWMFRHMVESGALQTLKAAKIPVVVIDFVPKTPNVKEHLDAVKTSLYDIGILTGHLKRAKELYKFYESRFFTILDKLNNVTQKPKVIVFTTWSTWKVYGAKGHVSIWVDLAKGDNIAAKVIKGASGYINPEYVLEQNPDVIVFVCNNNFPFGQKVVIGYTVNSTKPAIEMLKKLIQRPGWNQLKAVRDKRVYMMHLGLAHGHIFQFVALEYFAKWLHPEMFKNMNPINDLKKFYEIFMPYPLRGVWVVSLAEG